MTEEKICVKCAAGEIATKVLGDFTDMNPDVRMSWDEWLSLSFLIEETIKRAFGVADETEDDTAEKVIIQ